ncbi:MAG: hypothetical protein ABSF64_14960 [Bryobacteraceae bacterium]
MAFTGEDGTFSFPAESGRTYELNVDPPPGLRSLVKTIHVGTSPEYNAGDIVVSVANSSYVEIEHTLVVQGIARTSATISTADLAKLPQQTVKTSAGGGAVTFQGVLLADVFSMVATPAGEVRIVTGRDGLECRSTAALYDVLVQGKDGSQAVFAWADLDSASTDKSVYLVTKRDGELLPGEEGPFELVAPGDQKAAKWVRQVAALTIRRAK